MGYQPIIPTCLIQVGYHQMATVRHGVDQIIKKCLYLYQINLDLYETSNLSSWGTNLPSESPQAGHMKIDQPK